MRGWWGQDLGDSRSPKGRGDAVWGDQFVLRRTPDRGFGIGLGARLRVGAADDGEPGANCTNMAERYAEAVILGTPKPWAATEAALW